MLPPPALVTLVLSRFLAEHVTGQYILLILSSTLLFGSSLASYSSQHVGRHSSLVSPHKRPHCGCSVGWVLKGL